MSDATCPFCEKLGHLADLPSGEVVWEFPHSVAFLGRWQYFTGYCVLVSRTHATELSHLPTDQRHGYLDEMCLLAKAIEDCFAPDKLNYELLGNQVPHLHWHLFPRMASDPDRLRPVWFALDAAERDPAERQRLETGSHSREIVAGKLRHALDRRAKSL
jgi:diadenosine tetraphosphate (Ap4A) HIT family hydrolase